jgi:hypothetical protein
VEDELFGRLQWDEETQWWEGSVSAEPGEVFALSVQPNSAIDRNISEKARRSYERLLSDFMSFRQRTLQEFLDQTRNQHFSRAMTLEQFLPHLRPDEIMVRSDGYLEVGFADPEQRVIGGGHAIVSRFWPSGLREVILDG